MGKRCNKYITLPSICSKIVDLITPYENINIECTAVKDDAVMKLNREICSLEFSGDASGVQRTKFLNK